MATLYKKVDTSNTLVEISDTSPGVGGTAVLVHNLQVGYEYDMGYTFGGKTVRRQMFDIDIPSSTTQTTLISTGLIARPLSYGGTIGQPSDTFGATILGTAGYQPATDSSNNLILKSPSQPVTLHFKGWVDYIKL